MSKPAEKSVLISNVLLTKKERDYFTKLLKGTIIEPVDIKVNFTDQVTDLFQLFLDDCDPGVIKVCIFGTESTIEELSKVFSNSEIDHTALVRTTPMSEIVFKWGGLTLLAGLLGYGLTLIPSLS